MATKSVKPKEAGAAPASQLERVNAAVARLPRFDKLWLEKLDEALSESRDVARDDKSMDRDTWALAETVLKRAKDWNMLRAHPKFPKSFVGEE